ncbi:MAG: hypothetical protein IPM82_20540 [Saprospiraceae bacterium]|nr:hypothetical protein [Saprospiraceae bacterium]
MQYQHLRDADCPALLAFANLLESCNGGNTAYQVSFDLTGGTQPYTVTGGMGTLSGFQFTSNFIPSGVAYSFSVVDANSCGPIAVNGMRLCNCTSDVGTMSQTALQACGAQSFDLRFTTAPGRCLTLMICWAFSCTRAAGRAS